MKKTVFAIICAACAAWAAEMPRSEWHAKVGDCAQDPALLRQTISQLSPADQTAFLAEVNEAISKMPGSDEVKAAKFLDASRAAILGATPENRTAVLAEVFATVPPEFLTVVNESFAMDLFNRSNANTSRAISDADYVALASKAMDAIVERCATADHPEVRSTFAALMFERAAGGPTEGLRDALISKLPPAAQETARSEWMPTALGEGREKSYDPMLGVAEAGEEPNHETVVRLTSKQVGLALKEDAQSVDSGASYVARGSFEGPGVVGTTGADLGLNRVARPAVFNENPVGLVPVRDASGNVKVETNPASPGFGHEMYYGPNGNIVYKDTDSKGNTVYFDDSGKRAGNPYYREERGSEYTEPTDYVKPPTP